MAKRGKTTKDDDDDDKGGWFSDREGTDPDAGEDSAPKAPTVEQLESAGGDAYQVVEPGTIIDGIYYPRADVPERLSMTALLDSAQAQGLADAGVKLTQKGEPVEPTPKEPEPEVEPETESKSA